jgi:hypothetical protein
MIMCVVQAAAAAVAREIPELVAKRDSLLDELASINLPASPLDALIDKLGKQLLPYICIYIYYFNHIASAYSISTTGHQSVPFAPDLLHCMSCQCVM